MPDNPTRSPWRRFFVGISLASLSAVLLTLAFPPYELWPLIFVGLVPMIVAQHRIMTENTASLAYAIGVGGFFAGYFGTMFAHGAWYMRMLPLFIASIAGLVGSRDRSFHRRAGYRWLVPQGAVTWVGVEMIRGLVPVFGTWGFAAYALYGQYWFIQPVSIFGVYGLSLLIMLVNYTLGLCVLAVLDRLVPPGNRRRPVGLRVVRLWAGVAGIAFCGWTALSLVLGASSGSGQMVRVAAIQPAYRVQTSAGLEELSRLTREAARDGAELIVWNEGALPFDPQSEYKEELVALAAETGAHLVIGYSTRGDRGVRNESVILTPEGDFLGPYGKAHPVAWSGETSVTRGPYAAYDTSIGRLGMVICYDVDFTDTIRRVANDGARLIAAPSYDWPAVADKHYTHAVFRAVENRVAVVKADVGFDSAIVDPLGRVLSRAVSSESKQAVLVSDVQLSGGPSLYSSLGDWVGWLAIVAMLGFAALNYVTHAQRDPLQ